MPDSSNDTSSSSSSISSHSSGGKLPRLKDNGKNGHNYGEWRIQCQSLFIAWDLWKYISGPESTPPVIPALRLETVQKGFTNQNEEMEIRVPGNAIERQKAIDNAKPWTKENNVARAHLIRAIPGRILPRIEGIPYASEIWTKLQERYQKPNSPLANSKKTAITNYLCTSTMDVAVWLDDMQRLYDGLCVMDPHALSDYNFALLLMGNLPETAEWRAFSGGLRQRIDRYTKNIDTIPITSEEFVTAISDEYFFRNKNNPDIQAEVFTARYEANKGSKRTRAPDPSTSTPTKRPRVQKVCTNPNCGKKGHDIADCFAYGGGKQGAYEPYYKGPRNIHLPPSTAQRATTSSNSTVATTITPRANIATTSTGSPKPPDSTDPGAFPPTINSADSSGTVNSADSSGTLILSTYLDDEPVVASLPVLSHNIPKSDNCYYDSGANRHVFHDRSVFESYENILPLAVNGFGENLSTTAIGRGSVRLTSHPTYHHSSILLTNVLHIPLARSNLVSGTQLHDRDVFATLGNHSLTLSHNGSIFLDGIVEHGMVRLQTKPIRPNASLLSRISPTVASLNSQQPGFCTA